MKMHLQLLVLFLTSLSVYSLSLAKPQNLTTVESPNKTLEFPIQTDGSSMKISLIINGLLYKVNLDSGSSNLMLKGQKTTGVPPQKYKCSNFFCFKYQTQIQIKYLDGELNCYATDLDITMGQNKFKAIGLIAYENSAIFENIQGIFGISFPSKANYRPSAFQSLREEGVISKLAYGFNLNLLNSSNSYLTFGQPSHKFYEGELDMYNILKGGSIKTKFKWMKFGKYAHQLLIDNSYFDTGSTSIIIPFKFSEQILQSFQHPNTPNRCIFTEMGDQFQLLLCRVVNFDDLPIIEIKVEQKIYSLEKENYLLYCIKHDGMHYCETHIELIKNFSAVILGDAFFSKYFAYFDLEDYQIGLARNKEVITLEDVLNGPIQYQYESEYWQALNY